MSVKNGRNHQATPRGAFEWANDRWGPFSLDAAASEWNAKCDRYYSEKDDALTQEWTGRVWCNPPWSNIQPFVEKAIDAVFYSMTAEIVVMLLPVRGGLKWTEMVRRFAEERPIRGRLKFDPPPGEESGSGGFEASSFYVFERPVEALELMNSVAWR